MHYPGNNNNVTTRIVRDTATLDSSINSINSNGSPVRTSKRRKKFLNPRSSKFYIGGGGGGEEDEDCDDGIEEGCDRGVSNNTL